MYRSNCGKIAPISASISIIDSNVVRAALENCSMVRTDTGFMSQPGIREIRDQALSHWYRRLQYS